jgi:lysosomal acid lipase/cholesteryl ester hydrolase
VLILFALSGNNRGNRYSHKHLRLSPGDEKYWDFCIDDLAQVDVPTLLAYVKRTTRYAHVSYIGLSQGTAQAFAAFAWNPELSESVPVFIALAPAVRAKGLTPSILASLITANLGFINVIFGHKSMLGYVTSWQTMLTPKFFTQAVVMSMNYLFGWDCSTISPERREQLFQHVYSFSSVKCVSHWFQLIRHGKLAMFQDRFLSPGHHPLNYDLTKIRCPIALFYGGRDKLVDAKAVVDELGPRRIVKSHCEPRYEHLDMLWADDACEKVFPAVIQLLAEYTSFVMVRSNDSNDSFQVSS